MPPVFSEELSVKVKIGFLITIVAALCAATGYMVALQNKVEGLVQINAEQRASIESMRTSLQTLQMTTQRMSDKLDNFQTNYERDFKKYIRE